MIIKTPSHLSKSQRETLNLIADIKARQRARIILLNAELRKLKRIEQKCLTGKLDNFNAYFDLMSILEKLKAINEPEQDKS